MLEEEECGIWPNDSQGRAYTGKRCIYMHVQLCQCEVQSLTFTLTFSFIKHITRTTQRIAGLCAENFKIRLFSIIATATKYIGTLTPLAHCSTLQPTYNASYIKCKWEGQCIIKTEAVGSIPLDVNCDYSQIVSRTSPYPPCYCYCVTRRVGLACETNSQILSLKHISMYDLHLFTITISTYQHR